MAKQPESLGKRLAVFAIYSGYHQPQSRDYLQRGSGADPFSFAGKGASVNYVQCPERDRIQTLVEERLTIMQKTAQEAARLAGQDSRSADSFADLARQNQHAQAEIHGLRLALDVHRSIHGC